MSSFFFNSGRTLIGLLYYSNLNLHHPSLSGYVGIRHKTIDKMAWLDSCLRKYIAWL